MNLKRPVALLIALLFLTGLLYAVAAMFALKAPPTVVHSDAVPFATERDTVAALEGRDFALLVSYTDRGFEPSDAAIKKGETVRFTNNASRPVWVAASDESGTVYPGVQNGCGSSAFDSCGVIERGRYWEFTFDETGTWSFHNNVDKEHGGTVTVRVQ